MPDVAPEYLTLPEFQTQFSARRLAILSDDSSEQGRAVIVAAAQEMYPDLVNEIICLNGNLLFVAISPQRSRSFLLSPMSRPRMNPAPHIRNGSQTQDLAKPALAFCESVEAREGVSTGISAADRARTISILGEEPPVPRKLVRPGHIFPVEVREGGVLVRQALPEGALDMVKLCGYTDAAVFADLLDSHGELLNSPMIQKFCEQHRIPHLSLSTLTRLRLEHETLVFKVAEARLPTKLAGELRSIVYKSHVHNGEHVALIKGEINPNNPVLIRVQPEFTFADVFGGDTPSTRVQIQRCLKVIGDRGCGVLVYLRRPLEGQLRDQVQAWQAKFQEKPATMMREYGLGAQILRDVGVRKAELLTGSKKNLVGLRSFGIEIVSQIPIPELEISRAPQI